MSSGRTRRHLAVPVLGIAVMLAAACSIPLDEAPRELAAELPDALLPAGSTTTEAPAPTESVEIYLARAVADGPMMLEAVGREIASDGSVNVILDRVFAGPTAAEQEADLVSPFAEGSSVVGTILTGTLLEVHLDSLDGFPQDDSIGNRLAYAMLVCTATELIVGADIEEVRILVESDGSLNPISIPVSDGDPPTAGEPVNCSGYESFITEDR
ncbi:MAG: hypothetical protein MAG471_01071 [Acidimicrobiaceae bacterium]|nr:hypothetical protein [Acidimicrobiaceae bacterium]